MTGASPLIESGHAIRTDGRKLAYRMELLDEIHFDIVAGLQEEIVEEIGDPVFYDPVAPDNIVKRFRLEGRTIGTFVGRRLVAFRILHFPLADGDNFGKDIGLESEELPNVVHLAATLVRKEFRGNGLAFKMNLQALKMIEQMRFVHVFATVFPANHANVATLFKTGLIIRGLKDKYGGKLRYIFYRDLSRRLEIPEGSDVVEVKADDIDRQKKLLKNGYCGIALAGGDGNLRVVYRLASRLVSSTIDKIGIMLGSPPGSRYSKSPSSVC